MDVRRKQLAAVDAALQQLREIARDPIGKNGWTSIKTGSLAVARKEVTGWPTGILRGEALAKGCSPDDVYTIASSLDARKTWDKMFDYGTLVDVIDSSPNITTVNHIVMKPQSMISSRMLVVASKCVREADGTIWSAACSVEDPRVKPDSSRVVATLGLAGWKIQPTPEGAKILYLIQSSPGGWVPSAVLNLVASEMPKIVEAIINYVRDSGPLPYITNMGAILSFYSTELERHRFHADFETSDSIAAGEQTTFFVSKKKYKGGVDIMLDSPDQFLVFWDADREYIVVINNPANPPKPGLKVKAVLQCGLRGDFFIVTQEGSVVRPLPSDLSQLTALSRQPSSSLLPSSRTTSSDSSTTTNNNESSSSVPVNGSVGNSAGQPATEMTIEDAVATLNVKALEPQGTGAGRYNGYINEQIAVVQKLIAGGSGDGWETVRTVRGVAVSRKQITGQTIGILRGVGMLHGFLPEQVAATAMAFGARKHWDEYFEEAHAVEVLDNRSELYRLQLKGIFPASPRDMALLVVTEHRPDGSIFFISRSVQDPKIPEIPGTVRASLHISGWLFEPSEDEHGTPSTRASHVLLTNLHGWIPSLVSGLFSPRLPLSTLAIKDYLYNYGPPPYLVALAGNRLESPWYSNVNDQHEFRVRYLAAARKDVSPLATKISAQRQLYPFGFDVSIVPADKGLEIAWSTSKSHVTIKHDSSTLGKEFEICLRKRAPSDDVDSSFVITVNGSQVIAKLRNDDPPLTPREQVVEDKQKQADIDKVRLQAEITSLQRQITVLKFNSSPMRFVYLSLSFLLTVVPVITVSLLVGTALSVYSCQ